MRGLLDRASVCFAGGVWGGLLAVFGAWLVARYGWTDVLGVTVAAPFDAGWMQARLLWCGLWGLLFLPPILDDSILWRGFFFSLCPTLAQVFFAANGQTVGWGVGSGAGGALVLGGLNALWGWATAVWVLTATGGGQPRYQRLR